MVLSDNPYLDLPLATLQQMQSDWLQVQSDIAKGGKAYSFTGRSFTRADMAEVRKTLIDVRAAIRYVQKIGYQSAQAIIDTQHNFSPAVPYP